MSTLSVWRETTSERFRVLGRYFCSVVVYQVLFRLGMAADTVELTEHDIPGAQLNEPLESATFPALRWWLLCRGVQALSSWKKAQLIERLI